jgi:DNA/RNA-binding domain of Phe-tRNA-synthetase-like protein
LFVSVNTMLKKIPVLFVQAEHLTVKKRNRPLERQINADLAEMVPPDEKRQQILDSFALLHNRFGGHPYPAAPQLLYQFLEGRLRLMQINVLVDLYNYISVKYALALGAHDLDRIDGQFRFDLTDGKELFRPLGSNAPALVNAGEYAYRDDLEILCRLDVKQCEKTKLTTETASCIFIIQGNAATTLPYLQTAAADLMSMVRKYCDGDAELAITQLAEPARVSIGA